MFTSVCDTNYISKNTSKTNRPFISFTSFTQRPHSIFTNNTGVPNAFYITKQKCFFFLFLLYNNISGSIKYKHTKSSEKWFRTLAKKKLDEHGFEVEYIFRYSVEFDVNFVCWSIFWRLVAYSFSNFGTCCNYTMEEKRKKVNFFKIVCSLLK